MVELRPVHSIQNDDFAASMHGGDGHMPAVRADDKHSRRLVSTEQGLLDVGAQGSARRRCGLRRSGHWLTNPGRTRRRRGASRRWRRIQDEAHIGARGQNDSRAGGGWRKSGRGRAPSKKRAHRVDGASHGILYGAGDAGGAGGNGYRLAIDDQGSELRNPARSFSCQGDSGNGGLSGEPVVAGIDGPSDDGAILLPRGIFAGINSVDHPDGDSGARRWSILSRSALRLRRRVDGGRRGGG